jgi:hypothetical protein
MKKMKNTVILLAASAAVFSMSSASFAQHYIGDGPHGWGPPPGEGGGAAVGIIAGFEAALLTTISADQNQYDANTLDVQAAAYEDTRVKGAVFQAFANQVAEQLGAKAQGVDEATFDDMVAQQILINDSN